MKLCLLFKVDLFMYLKFFFLLLVKCILVKKMYTSLFGVKFFLQKNHVFKDLAKIKVIFKGGCFASPI